MTINKVALSASKLADALANVLPHVAPRTERVAVLLPVRFEFTADAMRLVATDRFSLAWQTVPVHPGPVFTALVDRDDATEIMKMARKALGDIALTFDGTYVTAEAAGRTSPGHRSMPISRTFPRADGEFPKYRTLIPAPGTGEATSTISFEPRQFVKFSKLYDNGRLVKRAALTLEMHGPYKPTLVSAPEIEGFGAVLMPVPARERNGS